VIATSSGALIATATVLNQDIVARLRGRDIEAGSEHDHIRSNRLYVAGFGIVMVAIACALRDVVAALTVGTVATLATMIFVGDIYEPIYVGLASGLVVFLVGSLLSKPTAPEVMANWDRRSRGERTGDERVTDATIWCRDVWLGPAAC
jgi:SSS family solute:Na+ symporter